MNLKISSEKIGNPLLVDLLKKLIVCFNGIGQSFFVIGATARDIILQQLADTSSRRKTRDLDVAIAISEWADFDRITGILIENGFKKDIHMHQRFYYGDYELDIVPYGIVAKDDDCIYWPPEEVIAMSVKGFDEILKDSITVSVDDEFDIKIASLHGLFLLKFNAWQDRHFETSKDAEDMSFILSNYFIANVNRNFHPEVYDWIRFDEYIIGGYWLAHDLLSLLTKEQVAYYRDCIIAELEQEEGSVLINQILEHGDYGLTYEQVRNTWQTIAEVFQTMTDNE